MRIPIISLMPIHERRTDRGARVAMVLHRHLGMELRALRRQAGLSQRRIASEIGVDHAVVSRIEAGAAGATTLDTYARLFAVLGGRLSVKIYPDGQAVRDEAHLRLIARLRNLLHAAVRMRTEVPLGIVGDLRAWDAELSVDGGSVMMEAETALDDVQALERRLALKCRDGNVDVVLLLVSDTERNRRLLREHREALRARFPLDTRAALAFLRAGQLPPVGAIIVL